MNVPFKFVLPNASQYSTKDIINGTVHDNVNDTISRFVISPTWSLEYSILAVMISALAFIGVIGNIPVLIVYFRRRDNLSYNTFIKVLAFIDLLVCSFNMVYSIFYELHLVTSDITCRSCEFVLHFCISASNITLIAIAMERYIAVCRLSTKLNLNTIKSGVWIIFGLSALMAAPSVGTFAVVHDSDVQDVKCRFPHDFTSGTFCHFTYSIMGKTVVTAYQLLQAISFFISVLIITVLYSIVYFVLWKKSKLRRKMVSRTASTDMDSTTEALFVENCQRSSHKRARNRTGKCTGICDTACRTEISIHNDEISSEINTDNLVERQDLQIKPQHNSDTMRRSLDETQTNGKKVGRKIKFSVSAQSGRLEKLKRKRHYHRRTAKMLFFCTVIYIVTWLPFWLDIFGLTNCLILRYMFFIGNATNPIVYGIVNEQVRRAFKKLFFDCCRKWFRTRENSEYGDESSNISGSSSHRVVQNK